MILYNCDEVNRNFQTLVLPDINSTNTENAKDKINNLCNNICDILNLSVRASLQKFGTVKKPRHNKRWWNADCVKAKQRNKLFHKIWKESQEPKKGVIYESYKYAKKCYTKACKQAVNQHSNRSVININKLFKAKKAAEMWKLIRTSKPKKGFQGQRARALFHYDIAILHSIAMSTQTVLPVS